MIALIVNLMIVMDDPVPYDSNMVKDTLWFVWLQAAEKLVIRIIRISQSKPSLRYVSYSQIFINILGTIVTMNLSFSMIILPSSCYTHKEFRPLIHLRRDVHGSCC